MKTTLNIDDALLEEAREATGIKEKTTLVRAGLEALVARAKMRRLVRLGGSQRDAKAPPRRRSKAN